MMRWLLLALVFMAGTAFAGTAYVSPTGNDANDCQSWATACKTPQRGADSLKAPDGMTGSGTVDLADGTYTSGASVLYYRFVGFVGNCAEPWKVKVSRSGPGSVFVGEDHAVLIVKCMEIEAPSGVGIQSRQYTIVDYIDIRWGAALVKVSVGEMSKANCGGTQWLLVGGINYAQANGQSQLALGCAHWVNSGQSFTHFVNASASSVILFGGATFTGPGTVDLGGYKGVATNWGSLIETSGVTIPGASGWDSPAGGGQVR